MSTLQRFICALALATLGACGGSGGEEPAAATPVTVMVVTGTQITSEVYAPTRLEGVDEALIYPAVGGRVEQVLVQEGDSVRAGDRLVRLATDRQISAGTASAQAAVAAAQANETNSSRMLERLTSLYDAGAVSEQELDGARTSYAAARAALMQAQAGAMQAGSVADNSYITAPFDGRVGRVWARVGNTVGGGPVISIANSSALVARALFPERYLPRLAQGLPAYISISAFDGESFPGEVTAAARSVDPVSGLVPVEIRIADPGGRLLPGMTGRVAVAVETHEHALVVPEIAFRRLAEGFQLVICRDGHAVLTDVSTGLSNRGMVEVVSGLAEGDSVIVQGQFRVSDGAPVTVAEGS